MAGPLNILIVDDDQDLREALAILLQSEGHDVMEVADGRLGLEALASGDFGLIILDLMMPVMDGTTFLAGKAKSGHAAVPVVIFSSSPSIGLEGFADVVGVVPKLDGIAGLLGMVRLAGGAGRARSLAGGFHA